MPKPPCKTQNGLKSWKYKRSKNSFIHSFIDVQNGKFHKTKTEMNAQLFQKLKTKSFNNVQT